MCIRDRHSSLLKDDYGFFCAPIQNPNTPPTNNPPIAAWSANRQDSISPPGGCHWGMRGVKFSCGIPDSSAMSPEPSLSEPANPAPFMAELVYRNTKQNAIRAVTVRSSRVYLNFMTHRSVRYRSFLRRIFSGGPGYPA